MPTYREVNTGQVVTVEVEPNHLSGLARWERIEVELSAPEEYTVPESLGLKPELGDPIPFVETPELADSAADAPVTLAVEVEGVHEDSPVVPAKPDEDANKPVWVAYAKANGKTDADIKGKTKPEIIAWFA